MLLRRSDVRGQPNQFGRSPLSRRSGRAALPRPARPLLDHSATLNYSATLTRGQVRFGKPAPDGPKSPELCFIGGMHNAPGRSLSNDGRVQIMLA
jgi:hypothetical protein